MKDRQRRWLRYCAEDAKAAQAELDELADQGWELEELGFFTALFRRAERPRRCWVEPARWRGVGRKDEDARADYLALCAEGGWELLDEGGGLFYFRAKEGEDPSPIQTDGTVEWEDVWRKALWDRAYQLMYVGIYVILFLGSSFLRENRFWWEVLLADWRIAELAGVVILVAGAVAASLYVVRYRARCRRAAQAGEPFPVPGRMGARLRGALPLFYAAIVTVGLVVLLLGVTSEHSSLVTQAHGSGYLEQKQSIFVARDYCSWYEDDGSEVQVEAYDCASSWLADRIEEDLVALESDQKKRYKDYAHRRHASVFPEQVEIGFDRAWAYALGEDSSGLIFRQGDRVVRLEVTGHDLGSAEAVESLLESLPWEEIP